MTTNTEREHEILDAADRAAVYERAVAYAIDFKLPDDAIAIVRAQHTQALAELETLIAS